MAPFLLMSQGDVRTMKRARFFVGLHEIGDFTLCLSRGLREMGFQVTNVVSELQSPILERELSHDRYIRRSENNYVYQLRLLNEFINQMLRNDVFVFNWGLSFTGYLQHSGSHLFRHLGYFDLAILKAFGKKIIVIANGDDIRSRRLLIKEMERAGLDQHVKYAITDLDLDVGGSEEVKREKAAKIEKYADHIFTRPNAAQFLTRDYHTLWLPVDLSTLRFCPHNTDHTLVVHAPSDPKVKGTKYLIQAVRKLRQEGYQFDFELCQNMRNVEVRQKLASAQIAIDQLILPGYALFAVEAMASGCAVLGSAVSGYNSFPMDLPIMMTTPDTIYHNLKLLLQDQRLRARMAQDGRAYVEKYHDHIKVAQDFLQRIGEI